MQALVRPLLELAEFENIKNNDKAGMIQITDCVESQKTHLMYGLGERVRYRLIVCADETKAKETYEEYRFLDSNICYYPAKDMLFCHADLQGKILLKDRVEVTKCLAEADKSEGITVVTSFDGFMDGLPPLSYIQDQVVTVHTGDTLDFEEMKQHLSAIGYDREGQVDAPGQFAVRGGILDIYPLTEEVPVRIELWGDEVDSIRTFDLESQRSLEELSDITVYPASDYMPECEETVSFLDYFPKEETILFLDDPLRLTELGEQVETEFFQARENRTRNDKDEKYPDIEIYRTNEIVKKMNQYHSVGFTMLESKCGLFKVRETYGFRVQSVNSFNNSFELLAKELRKLKRTKYRVVVLSGSRTRAKRLAEDLRDYGLSSFYSEDMDREVHPEEIMVAYGHVHTGYEYPMLKFTVIAETDIFGKVRKKKKRKAYEGQKIHSFSDLKVGDYVVHENHGVGIYQGLEKIEVDKVVKDYMKISYRGGSNLYILATQSELLQKYSSADGKKPKVNWLGGEEWQNTKRRVKGAVQEIAEELVELYAVRQEKQGYEFDQDTVWQKEFEEMFPFEETDDQLAAIEDTKRDMESTKIMDRLICGDVGYGKTEIAIRAAFKSVQEQKQVAYLVPTTILAQQHYNTFVQRMKEFPIRVELLCRFRTAGQQKKALEDLKKGLVDIVIGTHRLLSSDVEFKDLGLLVVDEEQRFGVQHKEKIKQMKENVDVLTLTATPIPRTLHMSLIGIRDMSVLEEAPQDRLPIQTYVMEYDDEMIREAIQRELARNGQVYYVFNRIRNITDITAHLRELVPGAAVEYAHGRMPERQLEKIMYKFINGEIDVLVSTTIIETGLDIPNVNTMIIHDSDKMGLSQLYQLRGRIGRSNRLGYAFLLYRRDKMLKEVAEKRLSAIREFTDLGSGFKIAMRDLEIRGAGNLLGEAQHGHMEAVGYDLYCKMLNEAVKRLKGEVQEDTYSTTIDLNVDAYIPVSYIPNEYQKLDVYKRIASLESEEEIEDMTDELIDRFGTIPRKVRQLLTIAGIKLLAHSAYITSIEQKGNELKFVMFEKAKVNVGKIPVLIRKHNGKMKFYPDEQNPYFIYMKKAKSIKEKDENALELVKNVVIDIKLLIEQ